jgi:hypothetical protein
MIEQYIAPERFHASLGDIKNRLGRAMETVGLQTTSGLCHQINYAIALRLGSEFDMPIGEYNISTARQFKDGPPAIGFLPFLETPRGLDINNHTSLIVSGVEQSPTLIDGANDQIDSSTPFLTANVKDQNYNTVNLSLKRVSRTIRERDPHERTLESGVTVTLPKLLAACIRTKELTEGEAALLYSQFLKEHDAGLTALFVLNRDWLTYFAQALGVEYPSTQDIRDKVFKVMEKYNVSIPKIHNVHDYELNELAKSMREEGMI